MDLKPRTDVMTPNGYGFFSGTTLYKGEIYGVVSHILKDMERDTEGICWTPQAVIHGLWIYKIEDIKETNGKPKKKSKPRL